MDFGFSDESSPDSLVDSLIRDNESSVRTHPNEPVCEPEVTSYSDLDRELFGGPISSDESSEPPCGPCEPEVLGDKIEIAGSQPEVNLSNISHGVGITESGIPPRPEFPIRLEAHHRRSSQQKPEADQQNRKSDTRIKSRRPLQPLIINRPSKRNLDCTSASSSSIDHSAESKKAHQIHMKNRTRRLSKLYEQLRQILKLHKDTSQQHTLEATVRELRTSEREQSILKSLNSALTSENILLKEKIDRLEQKLSRIAA